MKKTKQEQMWDKEYRKLVELVREGLVIDSRFGVIDVNGVSNFVRLDFLPVSFDQTQDGLKELSGEINDKQKILSSDIALGYSKKAKAMFKKYKKQEIEILIPAYCNSHFFYGSEPKYQEGMSYFISEEEFNEIKEKCRKKKVSIKKILIQEKNEI
jgi:hypothetical protein